MVDEDRMNSALKSVVVVGGGSAGWITAGRIAAEHQASEPKGVKVVLIESPDTKIIGVGEGTWPTMRNTLLKLGISETEFMRECNVTFKQGAKFSKWVTGEDDDYYYHPLMLPQGFTTTNLAPYWHASRRDTLSFSEAVCAQEQVCQMGLAPKQITTPEYASVANYAYHLDAEKFTQFLHRHCVEKLGVTYVSDDVVDVVSHENGDIKSLKTKRNQEISGDLFVDCTGFSSLLLGKHFQVPFVDKSDVLFIDNALAVRVPYESNTSPIASHTLSTAQDAGWIWDIGLVDRRGIGYVYSSAHTDKAQAEQKLAEYVGKQIDDLEVRNIPIKSGHRALFWQNNCVAVGLSAGFLEPLEASALVLIELSAEMISEQLPACREVMDVVAKRFNQTFLYRWERIIEFLKLHYVLTQRTDSRFWIDNCDPQSIPESLQDMLSYWRYHSPYNHDFTSNNEVFPAASYQYVLYGMGFKTEHAAYRLHDHDMAERHFIRAQQATRQAVSTLPRNRDLINKIHEYGFQHI